MVSSSSTIRAPSIAVKLDYAHDIRRLHLPVPVNFPANAPPPIDESEWPSATASDTLLLGGSPVLDAVVSLDSRL